MENKNIIYIDYLDSYLNMINDRFPKIIRKLIYLIFNYLGIVIKKRNTLILACVENDTINNKMLTRLANKIMESGIKTIVCSELLMLNSQFIQFLKNKNYNILNGQWLVQYMLIDIIKKISYTQNKKLSEYEITILSNSNSEVISESITEIAEKCKILNIVTKDTNKFTHLEKLLEKWYGVIINVSTNMAKTIKHSDIAINIDFSNEELKECYIPENCILVQTNEKKYERKKGITICKYSLNYPIKYAKFFSDKDKFDEKILYESLYYQPISYKNFREVFKKDNLSIKSFTGINGKIRFSEIAQMHVNKNNNKINHKELDKNKY